MSNIKDLTGFYNALRDLAISSGNLDATAQASNRMGIPVYWGCIYDNTEEIIYSASGESPTEVIHQIEGMIKFKPQNNIKLIQ